MSDPRALINNPAISTSIGDIFTDRDPRRLRRELEVIHIDHIKGLATLKNRDSGPTVKIRLSRLKPIGNTKGFNHFVRDAGTMTSAPPEEVATAGVNVVAASEEKAI